LADEGGVHGEDVLQEEPESVGDLDDAQRVVLDVAEVALELVVDLVLLEAVP
jgi:hypothetical protein